MPVSETETGQNITQMLRDWSGGKTGVANELLAAIYSELHRQAAGFLRRERANHTLQTTELVHEAYLKLVDQKRMSWKCRGHFFAIAATAMRRILVDHAKKRRRVKRGGVEDDIPLEDVLIAAAENTNIDLIALDDALSRLAELDPQQERIVELRYFAGLSLEDTADTIGISRATTARDWNAAKAWLHRELTR
jgi:RNA polymerase sigma-70 factor (ECF subfamily)